METLIDQATVSAIEFQSFKDKIDAVAEKCKSIVINSQETLAAAKELAKDARTIEKLIEERRVEITKPLLDKKKEIDGVAKKLTANLNNALSDLRSQILRYEQEQERIRQEELRRIEEEKRRLEEELRQQQAEQQPNMATVTDLVKAQEEEKKIQSAKSNSISKVWTFEVVDKNLVPHEYMMVDETKVRQAIKLGIREIPGILIYQKEQLVLR